jgi:hypothetical protein
MPIIIMPEDEHHGSSTAKIILIMLILLVAWFQVHEMMHGVAIMEQGFSVDIKADLPLRFSCQNCTNATPTQMALFSSFPYFFDIIIMLIALLATTKWTYRIANIAFFDVIYNYLVFLFFASSSSDFAGIITAGRLNTFQTVLIIAVFTGIMVNAKRLGRIMIEDKREKGQLGRR